MKTEDAAPSIASADVVAGLVNDGSADAVTRAAVREAARRGSRVRFVQLAAPGLDPEERHEVDRVTFRSALGALRGHRIPCTFQVLEGDPGTVLMQQSQDAALLVVGHAIALHSQQHARCDVLTVSDTETRSRSSQS
jgi:hypothetical protein